MTFAISIIYLFIHQYVFLLAIGIGIPAATRVAVAYGKKDPQFVVIDEVAGQLIAVIAVSILSFFDFI